MFVFLTLNVAHKTEKYRKTRPELWTGFRYSWILVLTAYLHEAVSPLSLALLSLVLIHFRQVTPHFPPLPGEKGRWLLQC